MRSQKQKKALLRNLRVLVELECTNPEQGFEDITRLKAELDTLYQERYQGAVVRMRTEKYLMGKQPTEGAIEEEKRYAITKEITEIEDNNLIITDKETIAHVFVEHHQKMFGKVFHR